MREKKSEYIQILPVEQLHEPLPPSPDDVSIRVQYTLNTPRRCIPFRIHEFKFDEIKSPSYTYMSVCSTKKAPLITHSFE